MTDDEKKSKKSTEKGQQQVSGGRFEKAYHDLREVQLRDGVKEIFLTFNSDPTVPAVKKCVLDIFKAHAYQCQGIPIPLLTPDVFRELPSQNEQGQVFRVRFASAAIREIAQALLLRHGHQASIDALAYPVHFSPNGLALDHVYRKPGAKVFDGNEIELKHNKKNFYSDLTFEQKKSFRESRFNRYGSNGDNSFQKDFQGSPELPETPPPTNNQANYPALPAADDKSGADGVEAATKNRSALLHPKENGEVVDEKKKREAAETMKREQEMEEQARKEKQKKKEEEGTKNEIEFTMEEIDELSDEDLQTAHSDSFKDFCLEMGVKAKGRSMKRLLMSFHILKRHQKAGE